MNRRRALGQHFLRDPAIARAIVGLVAPTARGLVVEIGPGHGALTGELAGRTGRLLALEVDPALVAELGARFAGVEVREADARSFDYAALTAPSGGRALAVGNLPYSVGTLLLLALLRVPPGAFRPPPKVASAVLHLKALPAPRVAVQDERHFERVVRAAFSQRRKKLANALAAGLGAPLEGVRAAAAGAGVDPGRRAGTLTILEFARLAERLS